MINIIKTDLKNILRDPSLLMICFVPFIMLPLLRWGYPALIELLPVVDDYRNVITAMFCIVVALMPGTAMAFAMLDEKDNNLRQVLQILPVSFRKITLYRTGIIFLFGFLSVLMVLHFSAITQGGFFRHVILSVMAAASVPIMVLIPAFFAANKIEGATLTKGLNFLIMLPIPAFIFPGAWNWLLMVFPTWWVYFIFDSTAESTQFYTALTGGIIWHAIVLGFVINIIFKRLNAR
jgi:fluoroquinolone transport system permease protein